MNFSNSAMFQSLPFYIQIMLCAIPPLLLVIQVVQYTVESGYGYISFLYITSVEVIRF